MISVIFLILVINICPLFVCCNDNIDKPLVITTWKFTNATAKAWNAVYEKQLSALDAIESGCSVCEIQQCDGTVGYGGSPDENGETTLDAFIMDGSSLNIGAVAGLRGIKNAISVARHVLDYTKHSMLVGDLATQFALEMGFVQESLSTTKSKQMWLDWKKRNCQPNFRVNVSPNPKNSCGPYSPIKISKHSEESARNYRKDNEFGMYNHDTIGMVVLDKNGNMASGTSTNGAKHKIPGRVGDSPIPGAGAYVDNEVGGAAATGDGDVMMRFLPSLIAVESMRNGMSPTEAGKEAMRRIAKHYPDFVGGIVVVDKRGNFGAACHNVEGGFPFSIARKNVQVFKLEVVYVPCL